MAEEYSREAVFEILGQEVPDKECSGLSLMQTESSSGPQKCSQRTRRRTAPVKQLAFQDFTLALCELRNYEPKGGIQTNANT